MLQFHASQELPRPAANATESPALEPAAKRNWRMFRDSSASRKAAPRIAALLRQAGASASAADAMGSPALETADRPARSSCLGSGASIKTALMAAALPCHDVPEGKLRCVVCRMLSSATTVVRFRNNRCAGRVVPHPQRSRVQQVMRQQRFVAATAATEKKALMAAGRRRTGSEMV